MPKRKRKTNLNPATLFSLGVIVFLAIVGAVLALQAQRKDLAFNLAPKASTTSCEYPNYCTNTGSCSTGYTLDTSLTCSDIYSTCCKQVNPSGACTSSDEPRCSVDGSKIYHCQNNQWVNTACEYGCYGSGSDTTCYKCDESTKRVCIDDTTMQHCGLTQESPFKIIDWKNVSCSPDMCIACDTYGACCSNAYPTPKPLGYIQLLTYNYNNKSCSYSANITYGTKYESESDCCTAINAYNYYDSNDPDIRCSSKCSVSKNKKTSSMKVCKYFSN
jgi:hypothetical protein